MSESENDDYLLGLNEEIESLTAERDELKIKTSCQQIALANLEEEIDRLKAELRDLKIIDKYRTSPTPWLVSELSKLEKDRDTRAKEAEFWRGECEKFVKFARETPNILGNGSCTINCCEGCSFEMGEVSCNAKEALAAHEKAVNEAAKKERGV